MLSRPGFENWFLPLTSPSATSPRWRSCRDGRGRAEGLWVYRTPAFKRRTAGEGSLAFAKKNFRCLDHPEWLAGVA